MIDLELDGFDRLYDGNLGQQLLAADPDTKIHVIVKAFNLFFEEYVYPDYLYDVLDDSLLCRQDLYLYYSELFDCVTLQIFD